MPDFRKIVQRHLSDIALPAKTRQEIIDEIADHLTDVYDDHCDEGQDREQATSLTVGQIGDWNMFRKNVVQAKGNNVVRIRTVLLPGLAAMVLTIVSDNLITAVFHSHLTTLNTYFSTLTNSQVIRLIGLISPWLLTLPFCGAVGAYLARRAGANVIRRIAAATFPAWLMGVLWLPIFFGRPSPDILRSYIILLATTPLALFIGAIPFLKETRTDLKGVGT